MNSIDIKNDILNDLRACGVCIAAFGDIRTSKEVLRNRCAIDILLNRMVDVDDPPTKEYIIRSLSYRQLAPLAFPVMVREFYRLDSPRYDLVRWAIGNAIEVYADPTMTDDIIRMSKSHRYGKSREMLVLALAKTDRETSIPVLHMLANDPDVCGHAVSALAKIADPRSRDILMSATDHPKAWIRNKAKKGLAKIGDMT